MAGHGLSEQGREAEADPDPAGAHEAGIQVPGKFERRPTRSPSNLQPRAISMTHASPERSGSNSGNGVSPSLRQAPWCSGCKDYTTVRMSFFSQGLKMLCGATYYICNDCSKPMWSESECETSKRRCGILSIACVVGLLSSGAGLYYYGTPREAIAVTAWNLVVVCFLFVRPYAKRRRHLREFKAWSATSTLYDLEARE